MAWTTPRSWVAGETVTAAICNTHIRDEFNMLLPSQAGSFTVTFTAVSRVTGTLTFPVAFVSAPKVVMTSADGGTNDLIAYMATGPTATNVAWGLVTRGGAVATVTATMHWAAFGI